MTEWHFNKTESVPADGAQIAPQHEEEKSGEAEICNQELVHPWSRDCGRNRWGSVVRL